MAAAAAPLAAAKRPLPPARRRPAAGPPRPLPPAAPASARRAPSRREGRARGPKARVHRMETVGVQGYCEALLSSEPMSWWGVEPTIAIVSFAIWMQLFRSFEVHDTLKQRMLNPPYHFLRSGISSILVYWIGVAIWVASVPPPVGIRTGCVSDFGSVLRLIAECTSGLVAYDFLFYWIHLAMHMSYHVGHLLGHGRHHEFDGTLNSRLESSFRTTHHSIMDGGLQVLCNILVQRYTLWGPAKTRLARWYVCCFIAHYFHLLV